MRLFAMATVHRETQRGKKQESDQLVVAVRSLSAACRSTKPLQLLAAINCATRPAKVDGLSVASSTFGPAAQSHRTNGLLLQPISAAG